MSSENVWAYMPSGSCHLLSTDTCTFLDSPESLDSPHLPSSPESPDTPIHQNHQILVISCRMSIVYWGLFYLPDDDGDDGDAGDDGDDDDEENGEENDDDADVQPSDRGLGAGRRNCIVI